MGGLHRCLSELTGHPAPDPDPLAPHGPATLASQPAIVEDICVSQPTLQPPACLMGEGNHAESEEFVTDIYEWLSLIRLQSPRIEAGDQIDPYLSRYQVPGGTEECQSLRLCKISWRGFLTPSWARQILVDLILAAPSKTWLSMSMSTFSNSKGLTGDGAECTIVRPPKSPGEFLLWEVKSHE